MTKPYIDVNGVKREMTDSEYSEWVATIAAYEKTAYAASRAAEYPPITDYIDGIVKGDQAQVQAYIDACNAVKLKYPKPT